MTEAKLSYRRITERIAGKLDLLEAYLFYCLALCSDCYTAISHIKQEKLAAFYGITKEEQIGKWLHKFEDMGLIKIHSNLIKGKYGTFSRYGYELDTEHYVLIGNTLYDEPISKELKGFSRFVEMQMSEWYKYMQVFSKNVSGRIRFKYIHYIKIHKTSNRTWVCKERQERYSFT